MPTASDANSLISDKLQSMLGKPATIDQRLISSTKKILLERIEFEPAKKTSATFLNFLRAKYTPLNTSKSNVSEGSSDKSAVQPVRSGSTDASASHDSDIAIEWQTSRPIGAGLVNLGNTCFLNSVLQCLIYTPALYQYLESHHRPNSCRVADMCMFCELYKLFMSSRRNDSGPVKPVSIIRNLRFIAKHMKHGRQEDSHEFLRYLVDAMMKTELKGIPKPDVKTRSATVTSRIFGGFLRSQVTCLTCRHNSRTYDPFLDISLDIRNVMTIEKGLEKFVAPELLSKDNAYKCSKCCKKVEAKKRFTIHRTPNVLTIQLKRYSMQGGKISRHIAFNQSLNLRPYMSERVGEPVRYTLYAVLLHDGFSTNSGHYYCYVSAPNKAWYCMNDSSVHKTSLNHVLQSQAYLLFYRKESTCNNTSSVPVKPSATVSSPAKLLSVPNGERSVNSWLTSNGSNTIKHKTGESQQKLSNIVTVNGFAGAKSNAQPIETKKTFMPTIITCDKPNVKRSESVPSGLNKNLSNLYRNSLQNGNSTAQPVKSNSFSNNISPSKSTDGTPKKNSASPHRSLSENGISKSSELFVSAKRPDSSTSEKASTPLTNGKSSIFKNHSPDSQSENQTDRQSDDELKRKKKKKKKNKQKMNGKEFNGIVAHNDLTATMNSNGDSTSTDQKLSKKQKKKKRLREKRIAEQLAAEQQQAAAKQAPAAEAAVSSDDQKSAHVMKSINLNTKKKRRQLERHLSESSDCSASGRDTSSVELIEKKKKKKSAVVTADESKQRENSVNGIELKKKKNKKKKLKNMEHVNGINGSTAKNSPLQKSGAVVKEKLSKINGAVDVQKWDDKPNSSWNGVIEDRSDVVREMSKFSFSGYGVHVETWDGNSTVLDVESVKAKKQALKRSRSENYDEDIDRGRVKKMKKRRLSDADGFPSENPFQKMQNIKCH